MKKNSLTVLNAPSAILEHKESQTHVVNAVRTSLPSGIDVVQAIAYPKTAKKADRAIMLKDLVKYGYNIKQAAQALNISPSYASRLLKK